MKSTRQRVQPCKCTVCDRTIYKENERYRLLKHNEGTCTMTMIGELLRKVATDTQVLSILEPRHSNYICNLCRNTLVKVQRAQKHLDDAYKEFSSRIKRAPEAQTLYSSPKRGPAEKSLSVAFKGVPLLPRLPTSTQHITSVGSSSKHVRPFFSPSGISPAAKRPTLSSQVIPYAHEATDSAYLRSSVCRPAAARSLFNDGSHDASACDTEFQRGVQEIHTITVYSDLEDDPDEDVKVGHMIIHKWLCEYFYFFSWWYQHQTHHAIVYYQRVFII